MNRGDAFLAFLLSVMISVVCAALYFAVQTTGPVVFVYVGAFCILWLGVYQYGKRH